METLASILQVRSSGVDCRPTNGGLSAGNIRRIFGEIFETPRAEWCTIVDSRRLSTVELKPKCDEYRTRVQLGIQWAL
eukprot:111753-Prorocentrum_minimum.AAC.2